jgi:hypothetical protein
MKTLAEKEINNLGKEDVVVVWNDANDINRNETHIGLTHIREYVHARTNINVLVMTAPHRFDLNELSCINKEIRKYITINLRK